MDTSKFESFDTNAYYLFSDPYVIERDLQMLIGIIRGIKSDHIVNEAELAGLNAWLERHKQYENKPPYKEVIRLIKAALADQVLTGEEVQDIVWYCNNYIRKTAYFDLVTSGVQRLVGIIKGMSIDNEVNEDEVKYLDNWLDSNEYLKNTWPYDELYTLVTKILADRVVTKEESEELLRFSKAIVGDYMEDSNDEIVAMLKNGFCQVDPSIVILENTFCITGVSKKYKRREIAEKIELYGGYVVNNISSKLNYLIVCDEKSTCWAFTCYGRKIEEAIKHRKKGIRLVIVHENDLYDALEDLN